MLRWLGRNLSTLLLAFVLAVIVWVSAVVAADPNEERVYSRGVTLEVIGKDPALLITESVTNQVRLTLNAPRSIWTELNANPDYVRAWIDLAGLGKGEHMVEVKTQILITPVRVVKVEPVEVRVVLEPQLTRTLNVTLQVTGEPALGYRKGTIELTPESVMISGPESLVNQVDRIVAAIDISGASETIQRNLPLQVLGVDGATVSGVDYSPATIQFTQPINLLGGYRNVAVKVITIGEVADGYWLTNISVVPPNVTVFSSNPRLVNELPGFVETNPLDLTSLSDDVDIRATLNLPEGVSLAGVESVLVRLSIAAREGSLPISLPLEMIGLSPEFDATLSPETVDVLLTGPLPILNNLNPAGLRIAVNLTGFELGIYQIVPVVDLLPSQVVVASLLPEVVEVTIAPAPTPTPTPESGTLTGEAITPTVTNTPSP